MTVLGLILSILLGGLGVWLVARLIENFHLRGGLLSAALVGGVYGLLKYLLGGVLILVSLPLVILTLGLFIIAINAFLLWVTDKLLGRLEIRSVGALVGATVLLSLFDFLVGAILGVSGLY
jgi:putative membrane protein